MVEFHTVCTLRPYPSLLCTKPGVGIYDLGAFTYLPEFCVTCPVFMGCLCKADFNINVVCIVGAGIAGLKCAEVLAQQGLKVTILEGRDRIGGRVS